MGGEVRYCTTEDGVRIAYRVEGEGPPLLMFPFFLESFSLDDLLPELSETVRGIVRGRQLIRFDTRGTGLSDREVPDMGHDTLILDVEAVVRALNPTRFAVWGHSIGGLRAMDYAAKHPRQVDRLLLTNTFARVADPFPAQTLRGLASLARSNWTLAARTLADLGTRRESEEAGLRLAELYERSTTGEIAAKLFEGNGDVDLTSRLSSISATTLVIHRISDPLYPLALGKEIAAGIPEARLVPVRGTNTAMWIDPEEIVAAANAFLNEGLPAVEPAPERQGPLRTVLVTDLAGSTEMMSRLGDQRGREVLREHERVTRDVLKAHDGAEIKTMGDGFMASFASVTKAVECAVALQRAFEERNDGADEPLSVRVGLNAGEPIEEEGDLFGATVILAARVAARAEGGEVLASDVVRGLCSGKGFLFADRGEHALRGFEEPVRIFEVGWRP